MPLDQSPLRIGTAGWSVPARYAAVMPRGDSQLERYARRLNAVEINSSFYRPHQRKTYERWARSTPCDFRFSVKMPRTITHERRFLDCEPLLDRFAAEVEGLGGKLGVLLVQLPPKFGFTEAVADAFFRGLRKRIDRPAVLEPRHASWFAPGMDNWLAERQIARVAADPAPAAGATEPGGWKGLIYYRWHGSPVMYFSDYDSTALALLQRKLEERHAAGIPAWCVFDNTGSGAALGNALMLSDGNTVPVIGDRSKRPTSCAN